MDEQAAKPQTQPIAALTYLLGFVTGIIFLYVEPYDKDEFVRFHARQSIAFSVAWFAVNIIASVFIAILPHAIGALVIFLLYIINLAAAVFWVFLMYKAFTGDRYRIPELADWVDSMGL
ncbi:MAG TPA: DUF4870 domain-containing protein [Candidatus Binataceae bacterium]|jgi:uncharacterized membrane protein|nr:DUF4870 domain-containing protein [Candidatus Binataceae bacterium]